METHDFITLISEVTETPADELDLQTQLVDIPAWDSLSMVMFLATVDDRYNVQLSGGELAAANTVRDLYDLIASKQ